MNPNQTLNQSNLLLNWGRDYLAHSCSSPFLDARVIMRHAANLSDADLMASGTILTDAEAAVYQDLIRQRGAGRPVAYLTGQCEFMGLPIRISKDALIPRPDTETVAEEAIRIIRRYGCKKVLELCTGSGCLGIALAFHAEHVTSTDISAEALALAEQNAAHNGVRDKISFMQSDLYEAIAPADYDLVVANPPYIPRSEIPLLSPSVKDYEPILALDGGIDGLDFYRRIAAGKPNRLVLEIGYDQGESVPAILQNEGFTDIIVKKDLAGRDRVVTARYYRS